MLGALSCANVSFVVEHDRYPRATAPVCKGESEVTSVYSTKSHAMDRACYTTVIEDIERCAILGVRCQILPILERHNG